MASVLGFVPLVAGQAVTKLLSIKRPFDMPSASDHPSQTYCNKEDIYANNEPLEGAVKIHAPNLQHESDGASGPTAIALQPAGKVGCFHRSLSRPR